MLHHVTTTTSSFPTRQAILCNILQLSLFGYLACMLLQTVGAGLWCVFSYVSPDLPNQQSALFSVSETEACIDAL